MAGTNDCSVMTRVGPSRRTPLNTTTFAIAAARIPEYAMASTTGTNRPAATRSRAPGASNCAMPSGNSTIVPPMVAQVVSTSGEWRRNTGAANAV